MNDPWWGYAITLVLLWMLLFGLGLIANFLMRWVRRTSSVQQGFEVKLTGGVPVSEKKENDHG